MPETPQPDATTAGGDSRILRLRRDVYDRLAAAKGCNTADQQAQLHGLHRSTLFRWRRGDSGPLLATAVRIARDLDASVEELFEQPEVNA